MCHAAKRSTWRGHNRFQEERDIEERVAKALISSLRIGFPKPVIAYTIEASLSPETNSYIHTRHELPNFAVLEQEGDLRESKALLCGMLIRLYSNRLEEFEYGPTERNAEDLWMHV